jgi:hypothetical protein
MGTGDHAHDARPMFATVLVAVLLLAGGSYSAERWWPEKKVKLEELAPAAEAELIGAQLRNAAAAQRIYRTQHEGFTDEVTELVGSGFVRDSRVALTVVHADATTFCLRAALTHESAPWVLGSEEGAAPRPGTEC